MWQELVQTDYTFYRSIVSYLLDLSSIQVLLKYNHTTARLVRSDLTKLMYLNLLNQEAYTCMRALQLMQRSGLAQDSVCLGPSQLNI